MPGARLRRCDVCGKFHASYLVDDANLGRLRVCYDCWKAKFASQPGAGEGKETGTSADPEVKSPSQ